jgi:hypothetical protein
MTSQNLPPRIFCAAANFVAHTKYKNHVNDLVYSPDDGFEYLVLLLVLLLLLVRSDRLLLT